VIGRLLVFVSVALLLWLAAALAARALWGEVVALASAVAMAVCVVPALVTLLLSEWALTWSPQTQVTAILGGTGIRVFVVAGVSFALYQRVEWLGDASGFWTWVLIFYFVTLALEVALILWAQATRGTPNAGQDLAEKPRSEAGANG
jgi:hypothetical protein